MNSILEINEKQAEKKLIVLNRNLSLVMLFVFGFSIAYLFGQVMTLQSKLFDYLKNDVVNNATIIEKNSRIIQENTNIIEQLNNTYKNQNTTK
jgi:hypothetical protein